MSLYSPNWLATWLHMKRKMREFVLPSWPLLKGVLKKNKKTKKKGKEKERGFELLGPKEGAGGRNHRWQKPSKREEKKMRKKKKKNKNKNKK